MGGCDARPGDEPRQACALRGERSSRPDDDRRRCRHDFSLSPSPERQGAGRARPTRRRQLRRRTLLKPPAMSKPSPWYTVHRVVMWGIRLLPLPLGRLGFRAYHKLLRTRRWSYVGRSYFGATFNCDLRDLIQRMIFYFGVWEPDISRVIEDTLRPGDVFVDVG